MMTVGQVEVEVKTRVWIGRVDPPPTAEVRVHWRSAAAEA